MIDPEKEYSISEVSEITDYPPHVLRYYEKEFELEIPRNKSNHRYYTYKEIEKLKYIKTLQEKGFTNKQIKLILNSPEVLVNEGNEETAVTTLVNQDSNSKPELTSLTNQIQDFLINEIKPKLVERENANLQAIEELKNEIEELKREIRSKERDILICENAKLKMKVKEKSYEVVELKERLRKEKDDNKGIFKKIFKRK
ncbi:MerR family transcriptional regulator [Caldisalinibacter kiritimatiensis]|uniref:Regulatory protein, MerR n=1 Tax=Caldisalinibacter kiritimatiensis TaxID=1304284 RepID=R1AY83_9FIRM|nr:MerR family transcriptional regulator [Caldisalinibacter kiritimatiensis]EOD01637.1 regulatory protein, MerR [Caldisalinibacter kiritimatiensis]